MENKRQFRPNAKRGVTSVDLELLIGCWQFRGESGGIPHLAKNERDMGHPFPWRGESLNRETHVVERKEIADGNAP